MNSSRTVAVRTGSPSEGRTAPDRRRLAACAAALAMVGGVVVGQAAGADRWLRAAGVLPGHSELTELYLTDYQALPKKIVSEPTVAFGLAIRNDSPAPRRYAYTVTSLAFPEGDLGPARATQEPSVPVVVGARSTVSVAVDAAVAPCVGRHEVVVSLDRPAVSVHLYVLRRALSGTQVVTCG